ncbi:LysE family translocator [Endozoicomonas sp. SESOKO2]|uniref:LysE family translocator n=1 Tax=Endozoicomonas sp. SESOKO2 TaxID=2828743 RepID=UPI0021488602|nr:LysE family translocator [Endozoicomonas sp. SESOKO2]
MGFEVWVLYLVSIFLVIMIPGPLSLLMVSNSVRYGIIRSYPSFLGGTAASSLYLVVSATGLGVIITASDHLFMMLKVLGAVYLVYLGFMTIRGSINKIPESTTGFESGESPKFNNLFKKSFFLGASNPKDIIFFMAFLPQFISSEKPLLDQIVIVVVTWMLVDLVCKLLYGLLAKIIKPILRTEKSKSIFDRSTGAFYIIAGIAAVLIV